MRAPTAAAAILAALAVLLAAPGPALAASPGQPAADRGAALFRAGDFRGARDAFREAVRLDARHADAWHALGWAEYRLGNQAEAVRIWSDLLRLDPHRADTLEALAMVRTQQDRKRPSSSTGSAGGSRDPGREGATEADREAARARVTEREAAAASERERVRTERERVRTERERVRTERERQRAAVVRGDEAYRAGDYGAAERAYQEALASQPGNPHLLTKLGWVARRGGRLDEAMELWLDASRSEGAPPQVFRYLGDAYAQLGDAEKARAFYRRAIEATPRDQPGVLFQLADLSLAVGDVAEAERSLEALFAVPGVDAVWTVRVADLFLRHGAGDRGAAFLQGPSIPDTVAGKQRALARILATQAAAAFQAGRHDDAAAAFERALKLDPENRIVLRDLGWAHRNAGRVDQAEKVWKAYARAFPRLAEPHNLLADLHLDRGAHAEALAESRASLEVDGTQRVALVRAVRSLLGSSRLGEARRMAAELATRYPGDAQAQRLYAHALTSSSDFRAASRQWRRVLDLEPDSNLAKQNWVRSLYEAGEAEEAVREARRIAESPGAPTPVLELLAQDAMVRQDFGEAATWLRELTRRVPDQISYWRSLGQMLDALGRYDEEVAVAREALRRMPDRGDLQLELANALRNAGRRAEGIQLARRVVERFPDNRAAYETLVSMLSETGRLGAASREISRSPFYRDYERRMLEASFRARMNDNRSAMRLLRPIANPPPGEQYVPILVYHGIVESPRTLHVSAAAFADQMAALAARGYQAITLTELARMIDGELPFPPRPILITFDDARADSFAYADPILETHGLKASMFVPTGRIRDEDGFHVGWNTLARYARSGRWDMQAHGHDAHDPIVIDADGRKGEFLTYRAWLRAEGRLETSEEYVKRVDDDYRRCKREMEEHFPGHPILGYAYPLNQIGQARSGEDPGDPGAPVNEVIASRYFRFGLTQDRIGYNVFRVGGKAPFFLRRFEVPREFTGQQLLAHLARREPTRAARLEIARLTLSEGRPRAARKAIERIVREEPLVRPEAAKTLAQIAWDENRPRSAAAYLAASPPSPPASAPRVDTLANRLAWRNSPRASFDTSLFVDSDNRSFVNYGATLRAPLWQVLDLNLYGGNIRMTEPKMGSLTGVEVAGSAATSLGRHLDVSGWARYRELSVVEPSANGGFGVRLRAEQHAFGVRWSHEDVDTVPAQMFGIRRNLLGANYSFNTPHWRAEADLTRITFTDDNLRNDVHATLLRRLGSTGDWAVGGSVAYEHSRFDPAEYYAPRKLVQVMGRVSYRHTWRDSTSVTADAGAGGARDPVNDLRQAGFARLRLSRWWGSRLKVATSLEVQGRAVPGYQSVETTFRLDTRF